MKPIKPSFLLLLLLCPSVQAVDTVSLTLANMSANTWRTEGIAIELSDINKNSQQLALSIAKLELLAPTTHLSLVNIRCTTFTWNNDSVRCSQGHASLVSPNWQTSQANFSFSIQKNRVAFKLTDLPALGGIASMDAVLENDDWSAHINMQEAEAKSLLALLPSKAFAINTGKISFQLTASGNQQRVDKLLLASELKQVTGQSTTGNIATEKLDLNVQINAQNTNDVWQWQSQAQLKAGVLYIDPLYIKPDSAAITLNTQGELNTAQQHITVQAIQLQQPQTGVLSGSASLNYQKELTLEQAQFNLHSDTLQQLATVYLKPFFVQSVVDTLSFTGRLDTEFAIKNGLFTSLSATVNKLAISDSTKHLQLQNANGTIHWSADENFNKPSFFAWQQLQLYKLPVGASQLKFLTHASNIELLNETELPFLGGDIHIKQFKWQANAERKVYFQGDMQHVSLQKLAAALKWQPLSGTLEGHIPQVSYTNNTLKLDGEFIIKVFDGTINISKLAAANLLNGSPTFSSEIDIEQLDLEQLTSKYQFGNITGKLSGFVKQLQIENGQPISFLAWLGTPDNDDSTHRISQKAVNNIAQIGGNGASDLVSRGFLSLFDTFSYDKIGIGCYLYQGVCQLSGVEATDLGYTLVKGGGLPRIEVIAYNTRLDWSVLMQRLARISTTDKVIIK